MLNSFLKPIKSLVSLLYSLRKIMEKKLTKVKVNDLSGLIVTTVVLLSVQAFNTFLILFILEHLLVYIDK